MNKRKLKRILNNKKNWRLFERLANDRELIYMPRVDLSKADLSRAILWKTKLSHAELWYADLSYADLSKAKLKHANLWNANLQHANLWFAKFKNTDFGSYKLVKEVANGKRRPKNW